MRYKRRKKNRIGLWIFGLLILLIIIGAAGKINEKGNTADSTPSEERTETTKKDSVMEVHFVDVGQGDCTLIICDGEAMIIDAGDNNQGTKVQLYLKKHGVEKLKYVVASHPDADHIGGLDVIIYKFECENILVPNCENDTRTYDAFIGSIKAKGYKSEVVDVGNRYSLGGASFEILSPFKDFTYEDTNNSSIILRIDHGENSFLFTGDALAQAQQTIIYDDELNADADVIKVPHHGANSGYMKAFYDEVTPEYAVISCGKDNSYGHPSASVLNELKSRKTKMFRTDLQGTVIAVSDTMNISFNVEPSDNWEPGDRQ